MCEPSFNTSGRPCRAWRACDEEMLILEHEVITEAPGVSRHCMMLLVRLSLEGSVFLECNAS
ncbi:hypothetical protein E2C01_029511 [Portunus trituberculatus]|uniref:Uncharacterized protein n=1 Tax=Portunus trituberculatus TaxID=210409 RepID=A0A5B7ERM9_PORTR|nr:hypothetical protein [Portunus trituberculatus]